MRGFGIGRGATWDCFQFATVCTSSSRRRWWAQQNRMGTSKSLSRINNGATLSKNSLIFDQEGLSPDAVIAVIAMTKTTIPSGTHSCLVLLYRAVAINWNPVFHHSSVPSWTISTFSQMMCCTSLSWKIWPHNCATAYFVRLWWNRPSLKYKLLLFICRHKYI